MSLDLTTECQQGFDAGSGTASPHMDTSPVDDAFRIGRWLDDTGRVRPQRCRRSRGSTYVVNDMVIGIAWKKQGRGRPAVCVVERVS